MQAMTPADVRARREAAHKFLEVAGLVPLDEDASYPAVAGSLAVLAGIAASDAICGHVIKERPRGQDHGQAATVLARVRDGARSAAALERLLADKDASQYGTTYLSRERAEQMLRRAALVVEEMERLLRA